MTLWSILERARERWPDRVALVQGEESRTWEQTRERCAALAVELAGCGLGPGERVAFLGSNSAAYFEAYFALVGLGAILVPLGTRLTAPELKGALLDAQPRLWIADPGAHGRVREAADQLPDLELILWNGELPPKRAAAGGRFSERSLLELSLTQAASFTPQEAQADAVAQIYYTSGTTGRPKGVILTHGNVHQHALAATSELDLAEDDVWGHIAPMHHLADAWAVFALTLAGGTHAFFPHFEAGAVLKGMDRWGVTITNLVPTMVLRVLAAFEGGATSPRALRTLLSGGAAIAPQTVREVIERLGCEYIQTYGMTETSPYLTLSTLQHHHRLLPLEERLRIAARTGRPFETVDLEVVDDQDRPVPADDESVGEIRVRGVTVSPGYWRNPEETAAAFRDGWLYTGDLAVLNSEGYVNIVDRKKDLIISGGENVSTIEVENALYEHPAVLEVAVFGVPHPEWGEEVRAAVCLKGPATSEELIAFARTRLANFKCPRQLEVLEELPRTGSGKIQKARLRERVRQQLED